MGIYFRLLFLTLPLFTGLSILLGVFFSKMFHSEYERAFAQKWSTVPIAFSSFERDGSLEFKDGLYRFVEQEAEPSGMLAFYRIQGDTVECVWSKKTYDCKLDDLDKISPSADTMVTFRNGTGFVFYDSTDEGHSRFVLAADDSGRGAYLQGFRRILLITVFLALVLSFLLPFLFSSILESQIKKIGRGKKQPWISELNDLDNTFRIIHESLEDLQKRNAGMLRSGIKLGSHYRGGKGNDAS